MSFSKVIIYSNNFTIPDFVPSIVFMNENTKGKHTVQGNVSEIYLHLD